MVVVHLRSFWQHIPVPANAQCRHRCYGLATGKFIGVVGIAGDLLRWPSLDDRLDQKVWGLIELRFRSTMLIVLH